MRDNARLHVSSPENMTLQNSQVALRLLGGLIPLDQVLDNTSPGRPRVLSYYAFWSVQAQSAIIWKELLPVSNQFTLMSSNSSGAYVIRAMNVSDGVRGGVLTIVYRLRNNEGLKWDLIFTPIQSGSYRLVFRYWNMSSLYEARALEKSLRLNYTSNPVVFSWADVPQGLQATYTVSETLRIFQLNLDLGHLDTGQRVIVDPYIVGTSRSPLATSHSFQRHVFQDPTSQRYYVFYHDDSYNVYSSSPNGVNWWPTPKRVPNQDDPVGCTPDGAECWHYNPASIYTYGSRVLVLWGRYIDHQQITDKTRVFTTYIRLKLGTMTMDDIQWDTSFTDVDKHRFQCDLWALCTLVLNYRYVNLMVTSDGHITVAWNLVKFYGTKTHLADTQGLYHGYSWLQLRKATVDEPPTTIREYVHPNSGTATYFNPQTLSKIRPILLPQSTSGRLRIVFNQDGRIETSTSDSWQTFTVVEQEAANVDSFGSALWDNDYNSHLAYIGSQGNLVYVSSSDWSKKMVVTFSSSVPDLRNESPSLTIDASTGDLFLLSVHMVNGNPDEIMVRKKPLSQGWRLIGRIGNGRVPAEISSNLSGQSSGALSKVLLLWREGAAPYDVMFASIPMETVWSPYSLDRVPWDGNGLVPSGHYLANHGEYISPSSGLLTLYQTDLHIPGRGVDLTIARVYATPLLFLEGKPVGYEPYRGSSLGEGWQLDFPWIGQEYLHLWNGQGYKIVWNGDVFENHKGERFRLQRLLVGYVLTTGSGSRYTFDLIGYLQSIADIHGNSLRLVYDSAGTNIVYIEDTVGKRVDFIYSGGKLAQITAGSQIIRYSYSGSKLVTVADALGRVTSYDYSSVNNWLIGRVRYPEGGSTVYTYRSLRIGTEDAYRVGSQEVWASSTLLARKLVFTYTSVLDDRVDKAEIEVLAAGVSRQFTVYEFTGLGVNRTLLNPERVQMEKVQHRYGKRGEIVKEIIFPGSCTCNWANYYRYDEWGNLVYSRVRLDAAADHEVFGSYLNTRSQNGFFMFLDRFQEGEGKSEENLWSITRGDWYISNGRYYVTNLGESRTEAPHSEGVFQVSMSVDSYMAYRYQDNGTYKTYYRLYARGTDGSLQFEKVKGTSVIPLRSISYPLTITEPHTFKVEFISSSHSVSVDGTPVFSSLDSDPEMREGKFIALGVFSDAPVCATACSFDDVQLEPYPTRFAMAFPVNSVDANLHDRLVGRAEFQQSGGPSVESYYQYDTKGSLVKRSDLLESANAKWLNTTLTFDSFGNVLSVTNPKGHLTEYRYDPAYNSAFLTSEVNTVSGQSIIMQYIYDFPTGNPTGIIDPMGNRTDYGYDLLNRLTRIVHPAVGGIRDSRAIAYDDTRNIVTLTDEVLSNVTSHYDGLGRLVRVERFDGAQSYSNDTYTYNWQNKIATHSDPMGSLHSFDYDPKGRIVRQTTPDGNSTLWAYDDQKLVVRFTGANGIRLDYWYDNGGRLRYVQEYVRPDSTFISVYEYDAVGNLKQLTTGGGQIWLFYYDRLNRLTSKVYPDGGMESFEYDLAGNLAARVTPKGDRIIYDSDEIGRPNSIVYPDFRNVSYEYDKNGNRIIVTGPSFGSDNKPIEVSYKYDARNRLIAEGLKTDGALYTVGLEYDRSSNLRTLTWPDQSVVAYSYDALNRIGSIVCNIVSCDATFLYRADDRLVYGTLDNRVKSNYRYDKLGRPSQITHERHTTTLLQLNYGYDASGNVKSVGTERYDYDRLDRLANATGQWGEIRYWYDASGDRTRKDEGDQTVYYTYCNNRLVQISPTTGSCSPVGGGGGGGCDIACPVGAEDGLGSEPTGPGFASVEGASEVRFAYDANGNMVNRNVTWATGTDDWRYTYDYEDHLTKVTLNGAVKAEFWYDGDGRLVKKREGSEVRVYVYAGGLEPVYEKVIGGNAFRSVYSNGMLLWREGNYYHQDHLGSTRLVTNSAGTAVFSSNYKPYGPSYQNSGSETYKYTGKPEHSSIGLYYYGARWYDPETGRFITPDLVTGDIGQPQTLNRYTYVANSPTNYVDPTGLFLDYAIDIFFIAWDIQALIEEPTWENAGWLALDIGLAVLPMAIAGAGAAARAAKLAGKAASHADDPGKIVSHLDDPGKIVSKLDNTVGSGRGGARPVEIGREAENRFLKQLAGQGVDISDRTLVSIRPTLEINGKLARPDLIVWRGPLAGIYEVKAGYASGTRLIEQATNYHLLAKAGNLPLFYKIYGGASKPFLQHLYRLGVGLV